MEEGFWIGREHNFQFSFYRAAWISLHALFNFFMHQLHVTVTSVTVIGYNIVFKVIVVNSLNTYMHVYSSTVNETSIAFCGESMVFNQLSSEMY